MLQAFVKALYDNAHKLSFKQIMTQVCSMSVLAPVSQSFLTFKELRNF